MNAYPLPLTADELLRCIESDLSRTREILHYEYDEPVTFLEADDIARCFDDIDDAKYKFAQLKDIFAELEATLRAALDALNTVPRFRVGDTDSYAIALRCDRILARVGAK